MRTTWCIAKRELGSFFNSPIAYIVLAVFVLISGLLFFDDRFFLQGMARMDGFFGLLPFLLMFIGPAIAMRLLAEERGTGTIELLLTMPVRDREVVIGKYIAAVAVLVVGLVATLPFAFTVGSLGDLAWGPVIGGYLGALLMGSLYLAAGLLGSALSRNQVVAFIIGLLFSFGIFAFDQWVTPLVGRAAGPGLHRENLERGLVELRSLVYFASAIGMFVVLSVQALESRKWR
jgi:ABC-2 type transport system permease protein